MEITCKDVFDNMSKGFDPEEAGDWEAVMQYNVEGDGGGTWVVTVKDGACEVVAGTTDAATATVNTDTETWVGMAEGTVDGTSAFMMGKIRIEGNMADVMKAQKVFKKENVQ